jgi:hypothetical protein
LPTKNVETKSSEETRSLKNAFTMIKKRWCLKKKKQDNFLDKGRQTFKNEIVHERKEMRSLRGEERSVRNNR